MRAVGLLIVGMLLVACGGDAQEPRLQARQEERRQARAPQAPSNEPSPAAKQKLPADQLRYEAALRDVVNARIADLKGTPEVATGASLREQASQLRTMSRFMVAVARGFAKVKPPQEVRGTHEAYVEANQQMARFMARVAGAMARGDRRSAERLQRQLAGGRLPAVRQMQAARGEFAALGYRLPGETKPGQGASPTGNVKPGEARVPVPPDTG